MSYIKNIFSILLVTALLSGCLPSAYYQKVYSIPDAGWTYDFRPVYKFEISDTSAQYRTYFVIKHTDAYKYSNIWLIMKTKKPGASEYELTRVEVPLAQQDGKWLGRGMGELWEQRIPLTFYNQPQSFSQTGTYEVMFEQNMRDNPLQEVLQVGFRVEKDTKR